MLTGDDVDLDLLPIQHCWPGDPAPFITLPAVITHDPKTGTRNVGMYRMQKLDSRSTAMHWQLHKDGRMDYLATDGRLEVAVALGLDPVSAVLRLGAAAEAHRRVHARGLPQGRAGRARARARPIDVEVPANAEIVLEGYVEQGDLTLEGPFGDHTGYYSAAEPFPVFHVTAMTMRADAIYPSIVVGKPPAEDAWLGKATERIFLPAIRMSVPEIVDYDLPVAGAFHNCVIVSIRKSFPGQPQKVMHAIWGLGLLSLTKSVVVVDEHVDVHDYEEVFFRVTANVDPEARRAAHRGPARPPRPRSDTAVLRRKDRHRRDPQGPRRGHSRVAGGDRHERRDPGARRPTLGRVRHRFGAWNHKRHRAALVAPIATSLTLAPKPD